MEKIPEFIANHLFLFSLLIAVLTLLFWNIFAGSLGATQLSPAEVTLQMNHDDAQLIDLRSSEDFAKGHILNALNFPAATLEEKEKQLQKHKDKPLVLCCANGQESARTSRVLKSKGYEKVSVLRGGIGAWSHANLPLTKDS